MAKNKDYVVHVQSSAFKELLATQQDALGTLKSIKHIMDGLSVLKADTAKPATPEPSTDLVKADTAKPATPEPSPEIIKLEEELVRVKKQLFNLSKDEIKSLKERLKLQDQEAEAISNISKRIKLFYSPLERVKLGLERMKNTFTDGGGIRGALLRKFNIGGVFNKAIEREKFIVAQKAMGSEKTRAQLKEGFTGAQRVGKQLRKTDEEIERFKKTRQISDAEMRKTKGGQELLAQKRAQAEEYAKYDERSKLVRREEPIKPDLSSITKTPTQEFADTTHSEETENEVQNAMKEQSELLMKIEQNTRGESPDQKAKPENTAVLSAELIKPDLSPITKTPTEEFANAGRSEESEIEDQKVMKEHIDLLMKIEQNTRGESPEQKAKPKEEESKGGGLLGNLLGGGGIGKALKGLQDFGVGIILVAGALWVASKAFQSFAEVEWENVGKGIVALGGLTLAAVALDKVKGSLISSSIGLGALALATWGISAAFKEFADLDWETIGKGFVAVAGLGALGVILGSFVGPAMLGALALGALGAAVWVVGKGFKEMQEPWTAFIEGIEKLSNVGFKGLAGVAGGLALLGPAMAVFAAGNVANGLSNLVTGFLSSVTGQKTPVEQLIDIGKAGEGISKAGSGMQALGTAMKAFSGIKKDDLKAINEFPWEKATKFVAAGGYMSANGAVVTNASKANADENAKVDTNKGGNTAIVNAPVNNVTRQNQIIKPQIRNQESSLSKYINSKYGMI